MIHRSRAICLNAVSFSDVSRDANSNCEMHRRPPRFAEASQVCVLSLSVLPCGSSVSPSARRSKIKVSVHCSNKFATRTTRREYSNRDSIVTSIVSERGTTSMSFVPDSLLELFDKAQLADLSEANDPLNDLRDEGNLDRSQRREK